MNQIKCPNCETVFTINETQYSQLLDQVRGTAFDKEVSDRLEKETQLLKTESENERNKALAEKDQEIAELKAQLDKLASVQALELAEALSEKDKEVTDLKNRLDKEVTNLQHKLDQAEQSQEAELTRAVTAIEKERDQARNQLALQEKEAELQLTVAKSDYEAQLKAAQEQVEFYKNFKAQQSTKAIGESLEIYAETEFNKVRSYAFPNAYFEKDNTVSARGSKGDFIFREVDENGVEIISIMFEMKNEADTTATKKKNSDFFKELDKDRREKNCEYAVLVTMLEADSDYYNTGIVDVSHDYEKMYVVRPQHFIQLIGLLRNAALNSLKYKQELAQVRSQEADITNFEESLQEFKDIFAKHYDNASNQFEEAIKRIDESIKQMEKVKEALRLSSGHLRKANNKLDDVSVKKLTQGNPTMREKFEALKETP